MRVSSVKSDAMTRAVWKGAAQPSLAHGLPDRATNRRSRNTGANRIKSGLSRFKYGIEESGLTIIRRPAERTSDVRPITILVRIAINENEIPALDFLAREHASAPGARAAFAPDIHPANPSER